MSLTVTGLAQALRFNRKVADDSKLQEMHEDIVKDTVSLMRKYAAVYRGEMLESIRYEKVGKTQYKIIIDSPHAIYQEFGTIHMEVGTPESPKAVISTSGKPAFRPFARPAVWLISKEFQEYINRVFMGFIK